MIKVDIFKIDGKKSGQIQLPEEIFGLKTKPDFIHQAVVAQLARARAGTAHTKIRSEVRGGGRKPWRQKGTGRARAGSIRSPLWIGGGVTFGPRKDRNWSKRFPKKIRRRAIFMALSSKVQDKKLLVIDKLEFPKIKTKQVEDFLQKMPLEEGSILVIIPKSDMNVELSFQNLSYAKTLLTNCLNIYDLLRYDWLITSKEGIKEIEKVYLKKSKAESPIVKKKPEKEEKKKKIVVKKTVKNKSKNKQDKR